MARFQAAGAASIRFTETPPDGLPRSWLGPGRRSLEIDVGCHKGRFLVEMASKYPSANFLGIERQGQRVAKARKKICQLALSNAAVVRGDGLEVLSQLPDGCADYLHVLFPDPWPKRRHEGRRLVRARFLCEALRILRPHAIVRLVTDDADYARAIQSQTAAMAEFELVQDGRDYPQTEFQIRFLADARLIHALAARRIS
jgi:tRNA (guanine-N7-)-methyltransferase